MGKEVRILNNPMLYAEQKAFPWDGVSGLPWDARGSPRV